MAVAQAVLSIAIDCFSGFWPEHIDEVAASRRELPEALKGARLPVSGREPIGQVRRPSP